VNVGNHGCCLLTGAANRDFGLEVLCKGLEAFDDGRNILCGLWSQKAGRLELSLKLREVRIDDLAVSLSVWEGNQIT
jgi:hypothetical protein